LSEGRRASRIRRQANAIGQADRQQDEMIVSKIQEIVELAGPRVRLDIRTYGFGLSTLHG